MIKAERERILQQIQSGALPADTVIPSARIGELDDELDEDELASTLAKRLKSAQQIQPATSYKNKHTKGGRR